ncbi:MAG: hypothetical protein E7361_02185 [Clostridiales bacterium]|nr:hypothetical protein [Clostridiales bacterium]
MNTYDIYLQSNTRRLLMQDITNNRVNHAYMIILPDNTLAQDFAKYFAMDIFCDNGMGCRECPSCNKILHDNMADIAYYPKGAKFTIEESRQIVSDSMVLPYEGDKKMFVIFNFETATPQSQNALLKVLEEPTHSNIFLIFATSEATVLQTIRSRSKKILEKKLDNSVVYEYLSTKYADVDNKVLRDASIVAGGSITKAEEYVVDTKHQGMLKDVYTVWNSLHGSADVLKMSNILSRYKDDLDKVLDVMMQVVRDLSIALAGDSSMLPTELSMVVSGYKPQSLIRISRLILECKDRLRFNSSSVAIIDHLLFGILEAKFICK